MMGEKIAAAIIAVWSDCWLECERNCGRKQWGEPWFQSQGTELNPHGNEDRHYSGSAREDVTKDAGEAAVSRACRKTSG